MKQLILITCIIFLQTVCLNAQTQTITVISGGTLIDGTGNIPISNSVIVIKGNRIAEIGTTQTIKIPRNAQVINANGKFILPGLIDTHLHLEDVGLSDLGELPPKWETPEKLRELVINNSRLNLIAGFTTVRDLGSTDLVLHVRDEINSNRLIGPTIIAADMQLVKKTNDGQIVKSFLEYDGIDDARNKVRYLKKLGADVVKIRLTNSRPIPSIEEVKAIVYEAHNLGLNATVHTDVPSDELVLLAIDASVDGIEHNAPLRSKNETTLLNMAKNKISLMAGGGHFYVQRIDTTGLIDLFDSTKIKFFAKDVLDALHSGIDSLHRQTQQMKETGWNARQRQERFIDEMQNARKAGVLLVFGTDCGANGMMHGEQYKALYGESQMGSTPMEVVLMATRDAAKAIGKGRNLGTVEVSKIADLIIVNENPLTDLRNLHQIFRVMKSGVIYDPTYLSR